MIRKAEEKDLPSILALYSEIDLVKEESLSLKRAQAIFSRIRSYPNYNIYITIEEREIVGTFALLIMDNLAHNGAPSGLIEDMAVREDWQGKGIGKQMMEYAMQICKEAACYKLALSSNVIREKAHKFYESLGFKKHGYSFAVDIDITSKKSGSNLHI